MCEVKVLLIAPKRKGVCLPMDIIKKVKYKVKENRNVSILLLIIGIASGYVFFFASRSIFNVEKKLKFSEINSVVEMDNREITLAKWVYCETTNKMEIELDILNKTYDGNDTYNFSVIDREGHSYKVSTTVSAPTMSVIQVEDVPKDFTELRLAMNVQYDKNNLSEEMVKFYTNIDYVERVNEIITYYSIDDYYVAKLDRFIAAYNKNISELQDKINSENNNIGNYNILLNDLKLKKTYAAGNELTEINKQISDTYTLITTAQTNIDTYNNEISEINKKIEDYKTIREVYINPGV